MFLQPAGQEELEGHRLAGVSWWQDSGVLGEGSDCYELELDPVHFRVDGN